MTSDVSWVGAALFLGPAALALYRRHGRQPRADGSTEVRPVLVDGLPGGTASALAHLVGVPVVIASGLTIAGTDTSTAPARAGLTVAAFDVGMGGWMLLLHVNDLMPPATDVTFWFLMQVGVLAGLLTGAPAVAALRRTATGLPAPA